MSAAAPAAPPAAGAETDAAYAARWSATVGRLFDQVTAWAAANGWETDLIDLSRDGAPFPVRRQLHVLPPADWPLPEHGLRERLVFHAEEPNAPRWRSAPLFVDVYLIPDLEGGGLRDDGRGWRWFGPGTGDDGVPWSAESIPAVRAAIAAEAETIRNPR